MPRPTSEGAEKLLDQYYPVLDHGFVALVDYMGNDVSIEHAARVSYGKGTRARSDTEGLLRYLYRHKHTTPYEMVEVKLHCAMPIFVARQWIRHRTASVNEYSGRYSLLPNVKYKPSDWRLQSKTNNQGSSANVLEGMDKERADKGTNVLQTQSFNFYNWLDSVDVARELSRIDLPLSSYTQWYWKLDLHNLLHFLKLRCDSHAQPEVRVYAEIIAALVKEAFPIAYNAWRDYSFDGVSLSYLERTAIAQLMSTGQACTSCNLKALGLSKREVEEFKTKFDLSAPRAVHELPSPITAEQAFRRMFPDDTFGEDS